MIDNKCNTEKGYDPYGKDTRNLRSPEEIKR